MSKYFSAGQHILELACGTGQDAVWLAQQEIRVTATDGSAEMVKKVEAKAKTEGVEDKVEAKQCSLQELISGQRSAVSGQQFDGVFSNFGGLNTIGDWRPLAEKLSKVVKPKDIVFLVPMGPFCPWEIVWHAAHGQFKTAARRFGQAASAQIGDAVIPIWYPPAKRLKADFSPWFKHLSTETLGLWLPPSYLDHIVNGWPNLFTKINQFENATAQLTKGWGDHYIIIFQKRLEE